MQCSAVQTLFSFPGLCFAFASLRLQLFPQPSGVPPASALFDSSDLEVMQYKSKNSFYILNITKVKYKVIQKVLFEF
jgi:hypothetical protein